MGGAQKLDVASMVAIFLRVSPEIILDGSVSLLLLGFTIAAADVSPPAGSPGVSMRLTFSRCPSVLLHYKTNSTSRRRTLSVSFITLGDSVDFIG